MSGDDEWNKVSFSDILSSPEMQATAASLYTLYLYYEVAGKPDLSTQDGRAAFWSSYYNSTGDPLGTVDYYTGKLSDVDYV